MATIILSAADRDTLERLLREGLSFSETARRTGLSRTYVARYATKRLGLTGKPKPPSEALARAIALVRDHGYSYSAAAHVCALGFNTVRSACIRRGITSRFPRIGTKASLADGRILRTQTPPL